MEHQPDPQAPERDAQPPHAVDSAALRRELTRIEAQPLSERAAGFESLHDELLAELQRSDHEGA